LLQTIYAGTAASVATAAWRWLAITPELCRYFTALSAPHKQTTSKSERMAEHADD